MRPSDAWVCPENHHQRGLVSGQTTIKPCLARCCCAPAFVMKFVSSHVRPLSQYSTFGERGEEEGEVLLGGGVGGWVRWLEMARDQSTDRKALGGAKDLWSVHCKSHGRLSQREAVRRMQAAAGQRKVRLLLPRQWRNPRNVRLWPPTHACSA